MGGSPEVSTELTPVRQIECSFCLHDLRRSESSEFQQGHEVGVGGPQLRFLLWRWQRCHLILQVQLGEHDRQRKGVTTIGARVWVRFIGARQQADFRKAPTASKCARNQSYNSFQSELKFPLLGFNTKFDSSLIQFLKWQ